MSVNISVYPCHTVYISIHTRTYIYDISSVLEIKETEFSQNSGWLLFGFISCPYFTMNYLYDYMGKNTFCTDFRPLEGHSKQASLISSNI